MRNFTGWIKVAVDLRATAGRSACLLTFALASRVLSAAPADSDDARLRDTLRSTMQALNASEADKASLQAAHDEDAGRIKDLTAQVHALTKRAVADRSAADKTAAALAARQADLESQLARLKQTLEKAEAANQRDAQALRDGQKEQERIVAENIALHRHLEEVKAKNAALFKLGNEILTRYEKYGLGQVLQAKEPFVGLTRVKLENQVQDYDDKLLDQRVSQ